MKKSFLLIFTCFTIFMSLTYVKASDSASASGYGYTLNGSITDSYISASATGSKSYDVNVSLSSAYYINTAGNRVLASSRSAMTYITYYGSSASASFWKWSSVLIKGTALSSGGTTTLRTLYN